MAKARVRKSPNKKTSDTESTSTTEPYSEHSRNNDTPQSPVGMNTGAGSKKKKFRLYHNSTGGGARSLLGSFDTWEEVAEELKQRAVSRAMMGTLSIEGPDNDGNVGLLYQESLAGPLANASCGATPPAATEPAEPVPTPPTPPPAPAQSAPQSAQVQSREAPPLLLFVSYVQAVRTVLASIERDHRMLRAQKRSFLLQLVQRAITHRKFVPVDVAAVSGGRWP